MAEKHKGSSLDGDLNTFFGGKLPGIMESIGAGRIEFEAAQEIIGSELMEIAFDSLELPAKEHRMAKGVVERGLSYGVIVERIMNDKNSLEPEDVVIFNNNRQTDMTQLRQRGAISVEENNVEPADTPDDLTEDMLQSATSLNDRLLEQIIGPAKCKQLEASYEIALERVNHATKEL